jgi:hypothetical protein
MLADFERRLRRLEEKRARRASTPSAVLILPDNFRWWPRRDGPPSGSVVIIPDPQRLAELQAEAEAWEKDSGS